MSFKQAITARYDILVTVTHSSGAVFRLEGSVVGYDPKHRGVIILQNGKRRTLPNFNVGSVYENEKFEVLV